MPLDGFQRLALEVKRLWVAACQERLERLKGMWEPWITRMLTEPLPGDWEAEIDRFADSVRHECGLVISADSIGQVKNLIRSSAGGTGVFAAAGPAPVVRSAPVRTGPAVRPSAVRPARPSNIPRPSRLRPSPPVASPPAQAPGAGAMPGTGIPEENRRYYTGDSGVNAWLDENYEFGPAREQLVKNWWDNFFADAAARTKQQYADLKKTADVLVKAGLPQEVANRILREAEGPFLVAPDLNVDPIRGAREKLWQAATAIPAPKAAGASGAGGNKPPVATMISGAGGEDFSNKRGPKTNPDAAHNKKVREVADKLKEGGNTIVAGGGGEPEKLRRTPGGVKGGRRPDIIYRTPSGELRGINVGRVDSEGNPVPREQEALRDLNGPGGLPTTFVPYFE